MKKEMNNIEEIEIMETEEEVMETETKQKFGDKVKDFAKKHEKPIKVVKKIAKVAAGVGGLALAYSLGTKKAAGECECYCEETELEIIDDNSVDVDPE